MNMLNREKIILFYLIIVINQIEKIQSSMEFLNENETDILFDLKNDLLFNRDSRSMLVAGSGDETSKILFSFFYFIQILNNISSGNTNGYNNEYYITIDRNKLGIK